MENLCGLVLCGGKSSRLGFPKYKITRDGKYLYSWMTHLLKPFCEKVYISCQASQQSEFDFHNFILDKNNDKGPMEGLLNAFKLHPSASWLAIACDLVYLQNNDVELLIQNNKIRSDAICYKNPETGEPFPLFTIYNPCIQPFLESEYYSGNTSAKKMLLNSNTIQLITEDYKLLKGINTPEELITWQQNYIE